MRRRGGIGEQELALWRYVARHAPVRTRDAAEGFGKAHNLSRTTVITMLERLRNKGYLRRFEQDGALYYEPAVAEEQLLQQALERVVGGVLGGSVTPFVSYLLQSGSLTEDEAATLRQLLERLKEQGG
ncbi:MAG: BlaI/MecI/CopY family transcriptional regulator [Fimbriimonadales bacterium]|nr:BlaI/MecI/CopY family transcriptional regulator [Fimbriimonadales bacterium]